MDPDLYNAARSGDVNFLKKEDIQTLLSQLTPVGSSVLHLAAESGQLEFFQEAARLCSSLLFKHANSKGDTPLHFAVRAGNTEVVKFIIEHAKNLPSDIEEGQDHVEEGYRELIRMANLNGDNALHLAARHNKKSNVARLLIEADPQLLTILNNESHQSACFKAIANRNKYVAGLLLSRSNPSCSLSGEINGMTVLHVATVALSKGKPFGASISQKLQHTIKLLEEGLDPFEMTGELDLLGKIVDAAPNMIKQCDDIGWTPLHYAAYLGSSTTVELFLMKERSAAYVRSIQDGLSALHIAASLGQVGSLKALLAACPDCADLVDNRGRNALHAAVLGGQEYAITFMLSLPGTLFLDADRDGKTPLHLDALHREKEVLTNAYINKGIRLSFSEVEIFDIPEEQKRAMKCVKDSLNKESTPPTSTSKDGGVDEGDYEYLEFSATLIATVTFTAAFTIPGGFIQSGSGKDEGMVVLKSKPAFEAFVIFDVLSFFASFSIVALLLYYRKTKDKNLRRRIRTAVGIYLIIAYYGMALAFTCGLYVVLGNTIRFSIVVLVLSIIGTYVAMSGIAFILLPSFLPPIVRDLKTSVGASTGTSIFMKRRKKEDKDEKAS